MNLTTIADLASSLFPAVGLWAVIFCTPLLPHLLELMVTDEPATPDDLRNWLMQNDCWKALQLYDCRWCQAFWTAVFAAVIHTELGWFWPFAVLWKTLAFYPITCFAVWKISHLENN